MASTAPPRSFFNLTGESLPGRYATAPSPFGGSAYAFAVVRYLSNGQLDTTFGAGGKVTTMLAPSPYPEDLNGCADFAQL